MQREWFNYEETHTWVLKGRPGPDKILADSNFQIKVTLPHYVRRVNRSF